MSESTTLTDLISSSTNTTGVLAINRSVNSAIDFPGDIDWWKVYLVHGYQYQIWMDGTSSGFGTLADPILSIYNSAGVFQHSANAIYTGADRYAFTYTQPSSSGEFFLSASANGSNSTGTYRVTIWEDQLASTNSAAVIAVNSSVTDRIGWQNDSSDWYRVTLIAGIQYQFDLIGVANDGYLSGLTISDPRLFVRDSTGASVAYNDDSGVGLNARIYYTPAVTGTFYLDVQASANSFGTYSLVVNETPTAGAMAIGTAATGAIRFPGDLDLYSLTLVAGVTYGFSVDGNSLVDPYLELLDSSGATLLSDDDSGPGLGAFLTYTPSRTGTYYLTARESGNNATGSYIARVWQLPTISISNAVVSEVNSGNSNLVFNLTLSSISPVDVTVLTSTSGVSTATWNIDYIGISKVVTIPAGQTTATFSVPVIGDLVFEPTENLYVNLTAPIGALLGDSQAFGLIVDNDAPYNLPSDPFVRLQWYLYPIIGVNAFPVWTEYTGAGITVAVFDNGIDPNHPDLDGNLLVSLGRSASDLAVGGSPLSATQYHGTMVAGVIAAERNGEGIVGVAYKAKLVSIFESFDSISTPITNAYLYAQRFDIINDSWGFAPQGSSYFALRGNWAFYDNFQTSFATEGKALADLALLGRNGLGTIVVQAAGNSFGLGDDTNLHNFQNSQYIITVAATDYLGRVTSYSSPGASVLVAAPGGGATDSLSDIISTDRVGGLGRGPGDYESTQGTSFSAPIVSGVVALMLEANPRLGYRDVQEILAYSARRIDNANNDWRFNGASNWNGGGLHYDALEHNLGYGLVDALAAVRLAETWGNKAHTAANRQQITSTSSPILNIPDNTGAGAYDSISIIQSIQVERVEVALKITHTFIGDLSILLTSPSGTTSFLLWRPQQNPLSAYGTSQNNINFTFTTVLNWGEDSVGRWRIGVFDNASGDRGSLDSWTLNLIGKPDSSDDTYFYTDEFSESIVSEGARATLKDSGGVDTINAAAVTTNSILSLVSGSVSLVDGQALTISATSLIENAFGGDGNDTIVGNDLENLLYGMRGDDTIAGGAGNYLIDGGQGTDYAVYSSKFSDLVFSKNGTDVIVTTKNEGIDTLRNIEYVNADRIVYRLSDILSTYSVNANATTVNEGSTARFTLLTTGVAAGTLIPYTLSGVTTSDLSSGALTGTITVSSTGTTTIDIGITADNVTEGPETLTFTTQGKSASVVIADTSMAPTYSINANATTVNEGSTARFTLLTTGVAAGTLITYTLSGVTASDLNAGALTGTITVSSTGTTTIDIGIAADNLTEGPETLTFTTQGKSASAIVNDKFIGGAGFDSRDYAFSSKNYVASKGSNGEIEVISYSGATEILLGIEQIKFKDKSIDAKELSYLGTFTGVSESNLQAIHRLYNTRDKAFFYTADAGEKNWIISKSTPNSASTDENSWPYVYQGSTFEKAHTYSGSISLHRFYNTETGHHFFTASQDEADFVKGKGDSGEWPFKYEGVAFKVYANDPTPNSQGSEIAVHRFYSSGLNRHFYTANQNEVDEIKLTGQWIYEGIGFWGEA